MGSGSVRGAADGQRNGWYSARIKQKLQNGRHDGNRLVQGFRGTEGHVRVPGTRAAATGKPRGGGGAGTVGSEPRQGWFSLVKDSQRRGSGGRKNPDVLLANGLPAPISFPLLLAPDRQ